VYGGFAGAQGGVDHLADGNSERADLARWIEVKPPRLTRRRHRDDDLVKAQEIEGVTGCRQRLLRPARPVTPEIEYPGVS
jgi:hypothetical protein